MKQVYADLAYQQQLHIAGLCSMQIAPRQWLASDPVIDFETGRVLNAIELQSDKFWLSLQLTQGSYNYSAVPKTSKSGDYYEVSAGGLLNTSNYQVQQILESIRRSELVVTTNDRNQRRKIIGDSKSAMKLTITHTIKNNPGEEKVLLDLFYQTDDAPPYYNPDNTPDAVGNFLINANGDFLLVE